MMMNTKITISFLLFCVTINSSAEIKTAHLYLDDAYYSCRQKPDYKVTIEPLKHNPTAAYEWLKTEAQNVSRNGNYYAMTLMAIMFQYGLTVEKDEDLALSLIFEAFEFGEPEAIYLLADACENGRLGVAVDKSLASGLYSSIPNSSPSLFNSFIVTLSGFLIDGNNYEIAKTYLQKLISKDELVYNYGLYLLGCVHQEQSDDYTAFKLFTQAAEAKHPESLAMAMRKLSECYRFGYGCEVNVEKADFWLNEAAKKGDEGALNILKGLINQE